MEKSSFFSDSNFAIASKMKTQHPFPWKIHALLEQILEKNDVLTRAHVMVISKSFNGEAHDLVRGRLCPSLMPILLIMLSYSQMLVHKLSSFGPKEEKSN